MKILENLKYAKNHEWIKVEGNEALIGISDFAQHELGDIVFVDVPSVGETLDKNEAFGSIEAVKTVSDVYMPVGGEVLAFNEALEGEPALINSDPYGEGWIVRIKMTNPAELNDLMDATAYKAEIGL
ncbi:MAG TPA: glycine cleavage system protein GcvH [Bacteroidales bacterium]|nr:glycine cleavage system protein GcvH [Bacteroidales bacterium]HOR81743.1 glycine cleavage system protein GcvH [Bacteroidales bacterium]HPJ91190.1 glycine cleavage system protein GcvH [Bacteroidales bacterium]